jgi:pimeloyl-ACP methyl ester carboxylesterase
MMVHLRLRPTTGALTVAAWQSLLRQAHSAASSAWGNPSMWELAVRVVCIVACLVLSTAGTVAPRVIASEAGITWQPCTTAELPTRECGELTVPLDYDEPDGATISVAVARVPATDQTERMGSLILNPGGPGGSGVLGLTPMYLAMPESLHERFDVVSFDPRGVGQSTPVRCFESIAERTAFFNAVPSVPVGPDQVAARQRAAEALARRCGERNAEILPHLSTANVAHDMDRLRQAVGDDQLTYLGSSYGTYLGTTYANLFPDRLRAMVLDGVINAPSYTSADHGDGDVAGPNTTSFLRILGNEGSAAAFDQFIERCAAAGPSSCAFAEPSAAATRTKFDALMDRLRAEPVIAQGSAGTLTVTYSLAIETVRGALYAAPMWSSVAQGLQRLEEGDAAGFLEATHNLPGPLPTDYVNTQEATPASNCVDADNPRDSAQFEEMARAAEERTPYFGALWAYLAQPCLFWPAHDADRYTGPWDVPTSATILLISRIYDPATPHTGAVAAAETLANARLLTIDGWGHSYFDGGRSTCANEIMAIYLIDLELPAPGTVCAEDAPPFSDPKSEEAAQATPIPTLEVNP